MSRTRLIRPQFFADERMAEISIASRLVYIGLWTLCDDAGYFEFKPRQIAASIFPYDGQARRQKLVDQALVELDKIDRIDLLECGQHAVVPTLPRHGAKGGNTAFTYRDQHAQEADHDQKRSKSGPVRTPDRPVRTRSTYESSSESVSGSGLESGSSSSVFDPPARAPEAGSNPTPELFVGTTTNPSEKNGRAKSDAYAAAHGMTRAINAAPARLRR